MDAKRPDVIYHRKPRMARAIRSHFTTKLSNPNLVWQGTTVEVLVKSQPFETALLEHVFTTSMGTSPTIWDAWWVCIQFRRLIKTWLLPSSKVTAKVPTTTRNQRQSPSLHSLSIQNKRSSVHWPTLLSWQEPALRPLSKIVWPNGPTRCSHRLSRLSSLQ